MLFPCVIFSQNQFVLNDSITVFINEIHYDNVGGDTLEGIEIAALSATDLSCYKVYLVNGNNGEYYATITLDIDVPESECGMGFLFCPKSSIQNGSSTEGDGIALYNACDDTLVQFISYEGVVMATNGPFSGAVSEDIGVFQNGDPIGTSLQLQGDLDSGFVWVSDSSSYGQINVSQSFCNTKLELSALQFDSSSCVLGENESIALQIKNVSYSNSIDSLIVFFQTNDSLLISDTLFQSLAVQDSLEFTFSQGLDLSQVGTYQFKVWTADSDTLLHSMELYADDSLFIDLEDYIVHCHDYDTLVLDAQVSGADYFSWNTGDTTQQLIVFPSSDTAFYVYAHNLCYSDTVEVEVEYVKPEITFMALNTNGGDTIYSDYTYGGVHFIHPPTYHDVFLSSIEPFDSYHYYYNYPYPNDTLINFYSSYLLVELPSYDTEFEAGSSNRTSEIIIYLEAVDSSGCFTKDSVMVYWTFVGVMERNSFPISIFPNPNEGNFTVSASGFDDSSPIQAEVFNAFGQVVHRESFVVHTTKTQRKFKLEHLEKGMYFIYLKSKDKYARKRLIIH